MPDADDRHVLAVAIHAGTQAIVTFNLKDFPADALAVHNIQALHPDDFLVSLLDVEPMAVCAVVKRQREALKNPPMSAEDLLEVLMRHGLVKAVARLRQHIDLL